MYSAYYIVCYFTSSLLARAIFSQSTVSLHPEMEYVRVCSNTSFEATCTSDTNVIVWRSSAAPGENVPFLSTSPGGDRMLGDFLVKLVSKNPLISTATLDMVVSDHNGTTLSCASTGEVSQSSDEIAKLTLLVHGPPSAPLSPKFIPQSFTSVELSWNSPSDHSHCITSYTINLTNITQGNVPYIYKTATNATSKIVSNLTLGPDYSFTVVAVDAEGRMGEKSMSSEVITLDIPKEVTNLSSCFSSDGITITWMPPPPSLRPPVSGYKIFHNTTDSVLMNHTNDTIFTVERIVPVTVLAFNVLGDGVECSVTASVDCMQDIFASTNAGTLFSTITNISAFSAITTSSTTATTELSAMFTIGAVSSGVISPSSQVNTDSGTITIIISSALVGCVCLVIAVAVIVILVVCALKTVQHRKGRNRTNHGENFYQSQEITSQYSMVTPRSANSCVAPPLLTLPRDDSAYVEVGPGQTKSQDVSSPTASHQVEGVQYAVLGERSQNAPQVLPPDNPVVYSEIKTKDAAITTRTVQSIHGESMQSHSIPPPLPPKPV